MAPDRIGAMRDSPIDVTVVTATYNRARLLLRAWRSLKDQAPEFEWIVVDDASTDETAETLTAFSDERIVYVRLPVNRGGPNPARNRGARLARGRYVVLLDDDDELYPGTLAEMVGRMDRAAPRIGAALFQCVLAGGGEWSDPIVDGGVYGEKEVVCGDVLGREKIYIFRREVFDHFELPEDLPGSEGVFVFSVSKQYDFLMVARPGRVLHRCEVLSLSAPEAIIARSRQIAIGHERILANHREVLAVCPKAEARYLSKALYRYTVAGCTSDALRMFRRLLWRAPAREVLRGAGILFLGLIGFAETLERVRAARVLQSRLRSA